MEVRGVVLYYIMTDFFPVYYFFELLRWIIYKGYFYKYFQNVKNSMFEHHTIYFKYLIIRSIIPQ